MSSKGFPKGRKGGGSPPPLIEGKGVRPSVFERLGVRSRDGGGNSRGGARSRSPPQGYSPTPVIKSGKMKKSGSAKDSLKRSAGPTVSSKKKSKVTKGRGKKRSSSSSSSSEEGSRSSTSSSSSSEEDSTSSTSEEGGGASSSDSSVPSVKLRTGKDKKKNLKSGKKQKVSPAKKSKPSKGSGEVVGKKKSRRKDKDDDDEDEDGRRASSRSSSGGRQQAPPHPMGSSRGGGGVLDLREKLNARSPSGYGGQQGSPSSGAGKGSKGGGAGGMSYHHHHSQGPSSSYDYDRDRDSHHQQHLRGGEKALTPKKRCLLPTPPGDPYSHVDEQSKRRRIMSPPLSSQASYEGHQGRRVPGGSRNDPYVSDRGRSPPGGGRRLPSNQEAGRRDYTSSRGEGPPRNSPYKGGSGGHYQQSDRHPSQDFRSSATSKERVAPLRAGDKGVRGRSPHHHHASPQETYSGGGGGRRPPLLSIDTMRPSASGSYGGGRSSSYDRPQRYDSGPQPLLPHPDDKPPARQSLLPKSKEALAEWYQSEQQFTTTSKKPQPLLLLPTSTPPSYSSHVDVDKWVDETVKVKGLLDTPPQVLTSPPLDNASDSSKETKPPIVPPPVPEASDLSDFSDDADSILNNELDDVVEKEEISSKKTEEEKEEIVKEEEVKEKPCPPVSAESIVKEEESNEVGGEDEKGDDLLQRIEGGDDEIFEAISDDEEDLLEGGVNGSGERENKFGRVGIVDALGVDWASLVVEEKKERRREGEGSVRQRWSARNVLKHVLGYGGDKREEESGADIVRRIGLGENSRALCSRRDYALRRHYLGLPQKKSAMSMGLLESLGGGGGGICGKEGMMLEGTGELLRLSLALFKSATGVGQQNGSSESFLSIKDSASRDTSTN